MRKSCHLPRALADKGTKAAPAAESQVGAQTELSSHPLPLFLLLPDLAEAKNSLVVVAATRAKAPARHLIWDLPSRLQPTPAETLPVRAS